MTVYSARLGDIEDHQFAAALTKAGLGAFMGATPIANGLFGQNVFLAADQGDYVFRGAPHWFDGGPNDAWQFPKERLYADLLHARTTVPVAWPQVLDDTCQVFPWPYLIAPRLPGLCLADPAARSGLSRGDFVEVAAAMGRTLADLQALTWEAAGDFDPDAQAIAPYPGGYHDHLAREIARQAADATANGRLTATDQAWLDGLIAADSQAPDTAATFAHNDFTLGNLLVTRDVEGWRVSGVIDLMTACFGDAAADLVRQSCAWFDTAPACVEAFLGAYRAAGGAAAPTPARLALLTAYERLLIWAYFTRPGVDSPFGADQTYRAWAQPYADRLAAAWFSDPGISPARP